MEAGQGTTARRWPGGDSSRVPYWAYTDPEIYRREQERVFEPAWNYVALAAEVPTPGDFKRSAVGETPVVVTRAPSGRIHVFENRCAHRGVQFCRQALGHTRTFTCPYHQWVYDLEGTLKGVPFERGVQGQGGMPADFDKEAHRPRPCAVAERGGVVFASFNADAPPFDDYLGPAMLGFFDRVFDGRGLRVLGYSRQEIPANWKLMFENIKDPYHASLLHVFLVSFGLFRADQPSAVHMDETGRHAVLVSRRGEQRHSDATRDIENLRTDFHLRDPRLLDPVREFPGDATVVMQTLWPNLIVQQQSNTLAMRTNKGYANTRIASNNNTTPVIRSIIWLLSLSRFSTGPRDKPQATRQYQITSMPPAVTAMMVFCMPSAFTSTN